MSHLKKGIRKLGIGIMMLHVTTTTANANAIAESQLATGTEALFSDLKVWLVKIAVLVGTVFAMYFGVRMFGADETDKKMWKNRIVASIIIMICVVLAASIISVILSYYL